MSGLIEFTHYQAEALLICLAGSLVWAGILFLGARRLERTAAMTSAEKLWTAALLFAVLPSLVAPSLAAFGVSLRSAPAAMEFEAMRMVAASSAPLKEASAAIKPALLTMEQAIGAAALFYVYGVFLTFFLWAARQAALQYAVARAQFVRADDLLGRIEDWAGDLGVRMPAIKRSRHVSSVCITGVFRQTVLIPQGIELRVSTDDLVLMCAHELAHVRRGDTRLFTATQLARVLFWFNPLVSRIASRAELAAEESADALVLQKGVDRRIYAACFVEGLKFAAFKMNVQPALAPSFTPPDRHGRRRRLNSILSAEPSRRTPLGKRLMLSAAASTVALVAVGQAAFAVDPESGAPRRNSLNEMPLLGDITSGFGEKSAQSLGGQGPAHNGLDIKAPRGANVFAPGDGVVVEATDHYNGTPDLGKVVVIDHGHGLVTRYAHLDSYSVKKGQRVKTGDVIAAVGATGKVTGPHLHFETLRDGEAVDPADVIIATAPDALDARPAIAPVDPTQAAEPAEAPTPAIDMAPAARPAPAPTPAPKAATRMRSSYAISPAPEVAGARGVRKFGPSEKFTEFKIVNPVIAWTALVEAGGFNFTEPTGFEFADGSAIDKIAEDTEKRLLGAANGEDVGSYNLTFSSGDKVYSFSSDEPMTAEKRAELLEALKKIRKNSENVRKEARKFRDDAAKNRENWRIEVERVKAGADELAKRDAASSFELSADEIAQIQRDAQMSRRDALEVERQALEEARDDLDEEFNADFDEALSDLDDAESDLEDTEMSREELVAARAALSDQRRQLQRDGDLHKRAIETSRRQIDGRIEMIDRTLDKLGDDE